MLNDNDDDDDVQKMMMMMTKCNFSFLESLATTRALPIFNSLAIMREDVLRFIESFSFFLRPSGAF